MSRNNQNLGHEEVMTEQINHKISGKKNRLVKLLFNMLNVLNRYS